MNISIIKKIEPNNKNSKYAIELHKSNNNDFFVIKVIELNIITNSYYIGKITKEFLKHNISFNNIDSK